GVGGMGAVVSARHIELGQPVAIKFMLSGFSDRREAFGRFLREARAASAMRSEQVVRVFDIGQLEAGTPYIVMERLSGESLDAIMRRRAPLPIPEAADCIVQACAGLAEAHSIGIVHRDLKPSNLFVVTGPDGSPLVKLLDFGISKMLPLDASQPLGQTL